MANGIKERHESAALAALRRCIANVMAAFALLARPARAPLRRPALRSPRDYAVAAGIAVAVLLLGMWLVDAASVRMVAQLPRWLITAFDEVTDFGKSGWFLWPLGILFLALAALPQPATRLGQLVLATVMVRVGFLFAAIAVPGLFVTIVKRMIGRARPGVGGSVDPFLFSPFHWTAAYAGMPSGHATTAFSVLVAVGTLWPRGRTLLLLYALVVAASRLAVNAHYPTDVIAGAIVGAGGALLVRHYFALRRLGFSIGADGQTHLHPGPSARRIKSVARELLT